MVMAESASAQVVDLAKLLIMIGTVVVAHIVGRVGYRSALAHKGRFRSPLGAYCLYATLVFFSVVVLVNLLSAVGLYISN